MALVSFRLRVNFKSKHSNDVIMSAMASQITSLTIVYSMVYWKRRPKETSNLRVTGLCAGKSPMTGEFPSQRARNAGNVSIWWRHHQDIEIGKYSNGGASHIFCFNWTGYTKTKYININLQQKTRVYFKFYMAHNLHSRAFTRLFLAVSYGCITYPLQCMIKQDSSATKSPLTGS